MSDTLLPLTAVSAAPSRSSHRAVGMWLVAVAGLVCLMVIVGGATRLTGSGLSMVDWQPVGGIMPPLNTEQWQQEFAAYQRSPEYQKVNFGIDLAQFKAIFWWEWGHRLLGRLIGLAFFLPLIVFLSRGAIARADRPRLWALLLLGGAQGLLGWYMVQSGLVGEPRVSHYRLAAHLSLALLLFSALLWQGMRSFRGPALVRQDAVWRRERGWLAVMAFLLGLQILLGAFVAGLKAGHIFNSWPLMDGTLLPDSAWALQPLWRNIVENPILIQFLHRSNALVLTIVIGIFAWQRLGAGRDLDGWPMIVLGLVGVQMMVGITTLLMAVPVALGTVHQGMAVIVLAALLRMGFIARYGGGGAA